MGEVLFLLIYIMGMVVSGYLALKEAKEEIEELGLGAELDFTDYLIIIYLAGLSWLGVIGILFTRVILSGGVKWISKIWKRKG